MLEKDGRYAYCPIFDNGAGLLFNTQISPMDDEQKALIASVRARPFDTTFTHQKNTAEVLYGTVLSIPEFTKKEMRGHLHPVLQYYAERDHSLLVDRALNYVMIQQRKLQMK